MPKVKEVCRHVRSKVAGPFWVTIDLMFEDREKYDRYSQSPGLSAQAIADIYGVDPASVQHYPVPDLQVLKISYPRKGSAGGVEERDMHSGQQYVYLLDQEL